MIIFFAHVLLLSEKTDTLETVNFLQSKRINFYRMLGSGLNTAARLFSLLLLRFRFLFFWLGVVALCFCLGAGGREGWSFRSCVEYAFGASSLAEIHCTQDEPRVGIAFWEQFVTPVSMPEEGYDTALA